MSDVIDEAVDWCVRRGWLAYGPYGQVVVTGAWPVCVALIFVCVLVAAYVDGPVPLV